MVFETDGTEVIMVTKIQISEDGDLFLGRADYDIKMQFCPFNPTSSCGDWCPHFDEFEQLNDGKYILGICNNKHIIADDFEDLRLK